MNKLVFKLEYFADCLNSNKCDPKDGHAEYVESVAVAKASQGNNTEFDTSKYKYISWGCTWHPLNEACVKGDNGSGHKPGEKCSR